MLVLLIKINWRYLEAHYASEPTNADNPKWHASHFIMYQMSCPHIIYLSLALRSDY